jgi:hypothetical protein
MAIAEDIYRLAFRRRDRVGGLKKPRIQQCSSQTLVALQRQEFGLIWSKKQAVAEPSAIIYFRR